LGWALSDLSRERLANEMQTQASCRTTAGALPDAAHGCFGDLLALLEPIRQ
jgi:hypothetical protein